MRPEDNIKYKRPTTPVRVRPYLFLYQTSKVTLKPGAAGQPPIYFRPQGNAAEGNRVTWGWWIRIFLDRGGANIEINGLPLTIPAGETTLIDTTKNSAGIDVSEYQITFISGDEFDLFAIEQILQIAEL
jgi:hypothetical protein